MRRSLPGVNYELAAAVRRVNAARSRLPEPLPDVTGERWHELEREVDRLCGAGDREGALRAISHWEQQASSLIERIAVGSRS